MKIEHIELYHVEIPLEEPFSPSWIPGYPSSFNHFTFIRLTTDEGIVGESAGMTMGKAHAGYGDVIGPFLIGRDPFDIEGYLRVAEAASLLGMRLAWIEPALWDIMGKASGQPVYRMLGGGSDKLRAYCSTGELRDADTRADDLLELREKGFTAVKLRFHDFDWRKELSVVEKARQTIGDSMEIMVDANQGWRAEPLMPGPVWDVKTAVDVARALENYGVYWPRIRSTGWTKTACASCAKRPTSGSPAPRSTRGIRNTPRSLRTGASTSCSPTPRLWAESRPREKSPRWRRPTVSISRRTRGQTESVC